MPDQRERHLQLLTSILEPESAEPTDDPVAQLCWAAGHGRVDVIESLLRSGVDANAALVLDLPAFDFYDTEHERTKVEMLALAANFESEIEGTLELRALCPAVRNHQVEACRALLAGAADPNLNCGTGEPILDAVGHGFADIVQLLIEHGATTDLGSADRPLIHMAAAYGHPQVTRVLLDAGMNPNLTDGAGHGPLLAAAYRGDIESARILIEAGALVDPRDDSTRAVTNPLLKMLAARGKLNSSTPLIAAVENGHLELVRLLLQHKPDLSRKDNHGYTAYDTARKKNNPQMIQLLRDAGVTSGPENAKPSDLLAAAASGDLKGIADALANGIDINTIGGHSDRNRKRGGNPLEAALMANPKDAKNLLLSMLKGTADPNLAKSMEDDHTAMQQIPREFLGMSALMLAAKNGHADAVADLIQRGADVMARSTDTFANAQTALYFATKAGHHAVMKQLIAAGADPSAAGHSVAGEPTQTPLHLAAEHGDVEAVKLLLESGAHPNPETFGHTPRSYAERNGHFEVVKLLKQAAQR